MKIKHYNAIFLRILFIVVLIIGCVILFQTKLLFSGIFVLLICCLSLIELYQFIKNKFLFYDKTIKAILNNDFSSDFSKHKSNGNYTTLITLYNTYKDKQNEQLSKDLVYRSILNNIETGIVILEKTTNDWDIFLMNDYFSSYFLVPKVSKWHYLKKHLESLCHSIEERNFEELKTTIQIKIDQQESQTFMLQTSASKTYNKTYYIILLDSIQKVIEKKEKEAWINLMKVISHELMNSITPIRSLTQNLNDLMKQEALSKEDLEDIKASASAMMLRSNHLQNFVESYRKLAMLPTPKKEKTSLTELLQNTLQIMQPLLQQQHVTVLNTITFNRWLLVDKLQLEQVLINLLTNSMYALQGQAEKTIHLSAEVKNNRVFITISDSGTGIDKAIEDKIFLPFFTTRKDGAGIGLTLSKNIIEAHGGYLTYTLIDNQTQFTICLVE